MIEFIRIDDRLIHGQVATTWLKSYKIEQVIVISDLLANDGMQKTVLQAVAPDGLKVHVFSTEQFVSAYLKNPIKRRTMLIFTNPQEVLICLKKGVKFEKLNVGGIKFAPGKQKLTKAVAVSDEEKEAFKELIKLGVDIEIQMVPNDKAQKMAQMIS